MRSTTNSYSLDLGLWTPQEPKAASDTPGVPGAPPTPGAPGTTAPGTGGGAAQAPGQCGGPETFLYMAVFLGLMYFMVLRPEQKRRKEQQNLLSSVKQGDRVVTLGGMHGIVTKLTEKTVTLRVDSVHMVFDRVAIARVERDESPVEAAKS